MVWSTRELLAQEVYLGVRPLHTHFMYIHLHKLVESTVKLQLPHWDISLKLGAKLTGESSVSMSATTEWSACQQRFAQKWGWSDQPKPNTVLWDWWHQRSGLKNECSEFCLAVLLAVHAISSCNHWTDLCGSLHHWNQLKEAFEEIIFFPHPPSLWGAFPFSTWRNLMILA